jgi:uncharacterized membrane protein YidH (DUF202 family)
MDTGMTPPDDGKDWEDSGPGLARERTELAWNRTALAFAALGGAALKQTPVAGGVILAMSTLIFMLGRRSRGHQGHDHHGHGHPGRHGRRALLLITIAVTAVSLAALVVALFAHGTPRAAH